MMDQQTAERIRTTIEDAVYRALEAGMAADDVRAEVEYAIDSFEDESP